MSPPDPAEPLNAADTRQGRMLAELAAMGMELARDLQQRALAAETTEEATRLAQSFHQISPGLRQTLALDMKLIRFARDLSRERAAEAEQKTRREADARREAVRYRQAEIGAQITPLIWQEADREEVERDAATEAAVEEAAEQLQARFDRWVADAAIRPDFLEADLDDLIVEAAAALGWDTARVWGDPDPPGEGADPEDPPSDSG
ncbi:hypothetical protein [Phenylobacterium sp.]|jgi:hypothetical protein|uniref:hypothetical protein n=1 Tax=Phenylobacterium sp. TaxID=1871053 RepID=UPI002F956170